MGDHSAIVPPGLGPGENYSFDDETTEHISLGDEDNERVARASASRTVSERIELRDRVRGRETLLTIYEEGFLRVIEKRRGRQVRRHRLDLRYLDPVPTMQRRYPQRLMKITGGVAGAAALTSLLAWLGLVPAVTVPAALLTTAAALIAAGSCFYLSHEKICFYTLHGRAKAIQIGAGLGYIRRYQKAIPTLVGAIEEAADDVGEDTIVYLRAEMREHYRLRGDGILSDIECSDSTTRILAHFDEPS